MTNPKITVLMPMYNSSLYIGEAVESILFQTFKDFELLIINDCSTDNCAEVVSAYTDPRIRLVHNNQNMGVPATLNRGIELAQGDYVARMDADDISMPDRLEKQFSFMESHPEVGISGTGYEFFGIHKPFVYKNPSDPEINKATLLFRSVFLHPSVIMRKSMLDNFNLRYHEERQSEDFNLWSEASRHFALSNLDDVLVRYRIHPHQVTKHKDYKYDVSINKVIVNQLQKLKIYPTDEELQTIAHLYRNHFSAKRSFLDSAENYLLKILRANKNIGYYNPEALQAVLQNEWLRICTESAKAGLFTYNRLYNSRLLENPAFYTGENCNKGYNFSNFNDGKQKLKFLAVNMLGILKIYSFYRMIKR